MYIRFVVRRSAVWLESHPVRSSGVWTGGRGWPAHPVRPPSLSPCRRVAHVALSERPSPAHANTRSNCL
eukprot:193899-Prymnesium_polylepis.1